MKTNKSAIRLIACLLGLMLLPTASLADEALLFEGPIPCERMTVDSVTITRNAGDMTLEVVYTLNDALTAEDKEGLELMRFNIMPDAEMADFPDGFMSGEIMSLDESVSAAEIVEGASYCQRDTWEASVWPRETLYLRPYYKFLGEWGEAIALNLADATPVTGGAN
ncbi:hypothetical protein LJC74_07495 [Eubacteriales bacterium OttesenSCG-928-A19]|nr:hypothetical protein [Eubacteriales bacterium OttesenSCG-928-A19]